MSKIKATLRYFESEWTNTGAKVKTNIPGVCCPRCGVHLHPDQELAGETLHACGDQAKSTRAPKKKVLNA